MKKFLTRLACNLFPHQMLNVANDHMRNPKVKKLRNNEEMVLDMAEKKQLDFEGFKVMTYTWKGGDKRILLIHGWEGQAGNFSDIVLRLHEIGYTVYAFDAPSHGHSSSGDTSPFQFAALTGYLIQHLQVKELMSHSFGGVATVYSLAQMNQYPIDKYVLLTCPDKFIERIDSVVDQLGITEKVRSMLINKLETDLNVSVDGLAVSHSVKNINVKEALVLHDVADGVLPIQQAKRVVDNWPVAKMIEIEGTGHFRILRDEETLEHIERFLIA